MSFKSTVSFESRLAESTKIRTTYPDRIPMIVERSLKAKQNIPTIEKKKFLTPGDLTVSQFIYILRKRITLSPTESLFLFINSSIPPSSMLLTELYERYKNEDGFLYVEYAGESTFG
ncbi:microtubial binding protein [Paraphysoderma sedebokerense]|nr:microtubial binding protein [Paraphysoderma sedebokerense]